jgi:hypothetical protein
MGNGNRLQSWPYSFGGLGFNNGERFRNGERHPSELLLYFTLSQLVTAFLNLCFCLNICFMVLRSLFFCVSKCLSSQDVAQKQEEEFRKKAAKAPVRLWAAKAPWEVESLKKSRPVLLGIIPLHIVI